MTVINTNMLSLSAQRSVGNADSSLATSMERLSSGLRINSAKDDAAGLAISDRMTSQIRGLSQAVRNANDGISMTQTAEGALQESTNIMQRMRELAVQSANDTNSAADRANLQKEVSQLQSELNRIANTTTFNGHVLLDGSLNNAKFHVGYEANQTINVSVGDSRATNMGANRISLGSSGGSYLAAVATEDNSLTAAVGLTVAGSLGTADVNVNIADSARDVAASVNATSDQTGVDASAQTIAIIDNISAAGAVTFDVFGQNEDDGVRVSAQLADKTDLTNLAKAINDVAGKTGVRAVLSDDKTQIMVENQEGYDITLENQGTATFDIAMAEVSGDIADGEDVFDAGSLHGAAVTVAAAGFGTVTGTVEFDSSKSFTVEADDATVASAGAKASTLEDIGSVDISSQAGANSALNVIDGALAFVTDQRADMGALMNRFENTISNLSNVVEKTEAAKSRIVDADFAMETAKLSKAQVLQQASMAMLAQANQAPQSVLSLLR
ncbi:MAG: flagellin [Granulosicoccaceae bacterium]